jgi:hypothetical protein
MYPLGIRGAVKVIANGEYTCDGYAVQDVSFEYTIYADDLNDQQTLQEHAARIDKSAKDSLQGWNLGSIKIRFVTGQECFWDEQQNACVDIRPLSIP